MKIDNYSIESFGAEHVVFCVSAALEAAESLRTLCRSQHETAEAAFMLHRWLGLPQALQSEIETLGARSGLWHTLPELMLSLSPEETDFEGALARLEEMPEDAFACAFLGLAPTEENAGRLRAWQEDPKCMTMQWDAPPFGEQETRAFLSRTGETQRALVHMLRAYWHGCFADIWEQQSPYLEACRRQEEERLRLGTHTDNPCGPKRLVVYLTVTGEPCLWTSADGARTALVRPVALQLQRFGDPAPRELLALLTALADETRLKILRLLWATESTTKSIAAALDLSPSTVSMHLKLMREAGLVESTKVKKFVFYRLCSERLAALQRSFLAYMDR